MAQALPPQMSWLRHCVNTEQFTAIITSVCFTDSIETSFADFTDSFISEESCQESLQTGGKCYKVVHGIG